MGVLAYFDLNRGARSRSQVSPQAARSVIDQSVAAAEAAVAEMIPNLSLGNVVKAPNNVLTAPAPLPANLMSAIDQATMYIGTVLGVIASFVFKDGFNQPDLSRLSWSSLLVAMVISILIIPAVFNKLQVNSQVPFLVRFGLCVQNGVFWQVLLAAAGKSL